MTDIRSGRNPESIRVFGSIFTSIVYVSLNRYLYRSRINWEWLIFGNIPPFPKARLAFFIILNLSWCYILLLLSIY